MPQQLPAILLLSLFLLVLGRENPALAQQCAAQRIINQWKCDFDANLNPICKLSGSYAADCNQSTCSAGDVSQSSECYVASGSCQTSAGVTKYCYILDSGGGGDGGGGTTPAPNDCGPYPCAPSAGGGGGGGVGGGGGGGGGGCNPNNWGAWSGCNVSCGSGLQSRQNECGTYQWQSCCSECGPYTGSWGSCSGSPATKSRSINYDCQASTPQSTSCTGSINARAVVISSADQTCTATRASTSGVSGTVHQFTPGSASQPAPQTQSGASYVTFAGVNGGSYTISPTVPSEYVITRACWSRTINPLTSGEGFSSYLSVPTDGETLTWDLGYRLGTPWAQVDGGNVYAATTITSPIPSGASPRSFVRDGTGGYPGLVTYGSDYDFDPDPLLKGEGNVSTTDWLAQDSPSFQINWYEYFWRKLGGGTTPDSFSDLGAVTKPSSRATPYYIVGDMTTSGDWVVGEGEMIIMIVNGNLTLGGKVNITGSGFAAFIVNGNITVSSSVGGLYTSSSPVIEGIYVTSPTGTFKTSTSSVPGKERFVGQGVFVAGSFLLQRDLDSVGANTTTPAELFLYNPRLLFTMPDSMRDVPITWEEVAP